MIVAIVWPCASSDCRVRRIIMSNVPFSISPSDLGFSGTRYSTRTSKEDKDTPPDVLKESRDCEKSNRQGSSRQKKRREHSQPRKRGGESDRFIKDREEKPVSLRLDSERIPSCRARTLAWSFLGFGAAFFIPSLFCLLTAAAP